MLKGKIGLVELIEDNDKQDENEKDVEKRKLRETIEEKFERVLKEKRELEDLLKEYMDMDELFVGDEKLQLFVKRFQEKFTTRLRKDEDRKGTSVVGHKDGVNVEADNTDVNVTDNTDNTAAIEEDEMERAAKNQQKKLLKKLKKKQRKKQKKKLLKNQQKKPMKKQKGKS
ncbi:hypothetical protein Tco_0412327 [Tanacetum coccineum]